MIKSRNEAKMILEKDKEGVKKLVRANSRGVNFKTNIILRRREVSRLYLDGVAQNEIADKLNVSVGIVANDLYAWRETMVKLSLLDMSEAMIRILADTDRLENAAWEGFYRSIEPEEKLTESEKISSEFGTETRSQKATTTKSGDARFLEIVNKQVERRAKLLRVYNASGFNQDWKQVVIFHLKTNQVTPQQVIKDLAHLDKGEILPLLREAGVNPEEVLEGEFIEVEKHTEEELILPVNRSLNDSKNDQLTPQ